MSIGFLGGKNSSQINWGFFPLSIYKSIEKVDSMFFSRQSNMKIHQTEPTMNHRCTNYCSKLCKKKKIKNDSLSGKIDTLKNEQGLGDQCLWNSYDNLYKNFSLSNFNNMF